ncbi:pentatricopeptide repeat-containing protein At1g59720, chloroplastic/mitochondrial-like [Apium graveolens]|uniref:pentatricopeptide repeat-containing protein At1g59720, chloroplastic/mitochondrial-like n=1 Tax=Apium graveolens TaxID=4045 RepID=UPI003D78B485
MELELHNQTLPFSSIRNENEEKRISKLISKCPNMRALHQIHAHILTHPLLPISTFLFSLSKLISFCSSSSHRNLNYAQKVFSQIPNPNIFVYNSMIKAHLNAQNPSPKPLFIFKSLISFNQTYPKLNEFTLSLVLKSCSVLSAFREGGQVHSCAIRNGFGSNEVVQSGLVNFYGKCEDMMCARKVFEEMTERNLVAWSSLISGYSKLGMFDDTLELFREMQMSGVVPDEVVMLSVVSACGVAGALDVGRWVHSYIDKNGIEKDVMLRTGLVNMYAKCGSISAAKEVFDAMPVKDTKAWSSMIVGFAIHGHAEDALRTFNLMEAAKVRPNNVTFVGVLLACAHGGLVSDGRKYWSTMLGYRIEPSIEHYGCMVDLLCRANHIEDAYAFVETMPVKPDSAIWRTLLVGCKRNKILEKGELVGEELLKLEPLNAENYTLIANLYASCFQWGKMSHVRKHMKDKGVKVTPGCTSIEVDGFVHEFVMGDWSHPEHKEIRKVLEDVRQRVQESGHEPWISAVLHNVGNEEKEDDLSAHSERLAIAYGLLKTRAPVVIRVVKNLRACEDCHEVTKIISKLYMREIIVRDRVRFHKFVNGSCSCGDFW